MNQAVHIILNNRLVKCKNYPLCIPGNLLEYWQPRIEKKNKREPIYTIKTYTHPITNFTNLLTMEGRKFFSDYPTVYMLACNHLASQCHQLIKSVKRYCLNSELPSTLFCKNMGLVRVRLTIFTLINFTYKSKLWYYSSRVINLTNS
ncbi:hypothetical protein Avbf_11725 [Armadillidium vulgare]|nr:hypothetical protein Avbf_11725 [Armadillidium vulgare]